MSTIAKIRTTTFTEVDIRHRMALLCIKHFLVTNKPQTVDYVQCHCGVCSLVSNINKHFKIKSKKI